MGAAERPVRVVLCEPKGPGQDALLQRFANYLGEPVKQGHELRFAGFHPLQRDLGADAPLTCRTLAADNLDVVCVPEGSHRWSRLLAALSGADVALILLDARATAAGLPRDIRETAFAAAKLGVPNLVFAISVPPSAPLSESDTTPVQEAIGTFCARLGVTPDILELPVDQANPDACAELITRLRTSERLPPPRFRAIVERADKEDLHVRAVGPTPQGRGLFRVLPAGTTAEGQILQGKDTLIARLDQDLRCEPGDVVTHASEPVEVSDQFEAELFWIDSAPGIAGRSYQFRLGNLATTATITDVKGRYSMTSLEHLSARSLSDGAAGRVTLSLDRAIPFEAYAKCHALGGFALVDPYRSVVVGAGVIRFALRRARNVHRQALVVGKAERARLNGHKPRVLWLTGLSGSGKSTIADALEQTLHQQGVRTYILDGDNVRHGLNKDLGFTDADRVENIRRIAEVAKLMADAGLVVITAFISPFRAERDMARALFDEGEFIEVYIEVPLVEAEQRDPKGLYRQARAGELPNFTGIDSPYEPPQSPEISLNTMRYDVDECVALLLQTLGPDLTP